MFPRSLDTYPVAADASLLHTLQLRAAADPLAALATAIFVLAILHTFATARITQMAHRLQARTGGHSMAADLLHFFGEVEVVFGLWVAPLLVAVIVDLGWEAAAHYVNDTVNYTEPLFVIVIMALASTRPILTLAEASLRRVAALGSATPGAWWVSILIIGPLLGSFITEPAAMTICALLLARQFFDLAPSASLSYATLGLLFVNVSIGGTLTHFAAPPLLMVARTWEWDTPFVLGHIGWRAVLAVLVSTLAYFFYFRREFAVLAARPAAADAELPEENGTTAAPASLLPVPAWITMTHVLFMAWTVATAHYAALFLGGFLFFLGFVRVTAPYQSRVDLKAPLLVGFFLAGLVIHGGLQAWWISPVLSSLTELPLFVGATLLTAVNDNALITYLATLVPNLDEALKIAVVSGAVTGGGLTVIANAPNPAGQALLARFFGGTISPLRLFLGALLPTLIAAAAFRLI